MRIVVLILVALVVFIAGFAITLSASASERGELGESDDLALLLARSCVGEAGWNSFRTGECKALMWVHWKRAGGDDVERMVWRYSAAVKTRTRKWISGLNREGTKPKDWPRRMDWFNYRDRWMKTLELADRFLWNETWDPLPTAMHYGGDMDHGRLNGSHWHCIETPGFTNYFYERQ